MEEIRVLDHGFVKLKNWQGDDLSVVNAARVSFAVEHEEMQSGDDALIRFLMRERHGTPFEHNSFTFHIKAPLFVVREWQRHRMGSYNELSGRYKEFENPDFYLPDEWRKQTGKPGAYTFEPWNQSPGADRMNHVFVNHYKDCFDTYKYAIENGIAKELARLVLPLSMYTEFYWTVNARSLMNFLSLRNSEQAQHEIREYAKIVEEL
jgi:thymidylate synthase (FAD)